MLGRPVTRSVIANEALRAKMAARGVPEPAIRIALGLYAASRAAEFATNDPTLGQLIGRRPAGMRAVIEEAGRQVP